MKRAQYTFPNYAGYKVRRLDDLLNNIPEVHLYSFIFDVRLFQPNIDASYFSKFNTALIAIMDKYNLVENSFVESKNDYGIQSLQLLRPDINQFVFSGFEYAFDLATQYNLSGVSVSYDELSKERIELLHANGLMASTFNTHSKKRNIKAVESNVDIIQTDKVKHLIEILK